MEQHTRPLDSDYEPGAVRNLALVMGAGACWGFAFSSFYLLPVFLTQELGAGPRDIGFVVGLFALATVACTPAVGRCVERYPRRYAVAAGAAAMSLSALGFLAIDSIGVAMGVLRLIQGASYALVLTAVGTMVADLAPPAHLSRLLGLAGGSMMLMNAIAPAVVEPLAIAAGWPAVFALAALAGLCSLVLALQVTEPSRPAASMTGGLLDVLGQPVARHYAIVVACTGMTFGAVVTFEQPYVLSLGGVEVRSFFVAFAAAAILVRLCCGHLPDRLGRHRVAVVSLGLYAAAAVAMAGLRPASAPFLGMWFGLAHGMFYPSMNAIAVTAVRPEERGRILAIFTGAFSLGVWVGATGLGVVAASSGYAAVFVVAACGAAVATIVLARSRPLRGLAPVSLR